MQQFFSFISSSTHSFQQQVLVVNSLVLFKEQKPQCLLDFILSDKFQKFVPPAPSALSLLYARTVSPNTIKVWGKNSALWHVTAVPL